MEGMQYELAILVRSDNKCSCLPISSGKTPQDTTLPEGQYTCLVYKKGDESVSKNWRPISLQPTVYKIMAAVLAKRLASWAITNNKISTSLKDSPYKLLCKYHITPIESGVIGS